MFDLLGVVLTAAQSPLGLIIFLTALGGIYYAWRRWMQVKPRSPTSHIGASGDKITHVS